MKKNIYSLIPQKVNNGLVVLFFELFRKLQFPIKRIIDANLITNRENIKNHLESIESHYGFIEDQNNYTDMRYGKTSLSNTGCEIIATFNTINSLEKDQKYSFPDIINAFENKGMVFSGRFGTSPKAIAAFLSSNGYSSNIATNETEFNRLGESHTSLILTFYNDITDIRKQVHTVCITKSGNMYTAHNVLGNGQIFGPFSSVSELIENINNGNAKGISLIGIKK